MGLSMPNISCSRERRKSASIRQTFLPLWAMLTARLQASVVLPSPASALVTWITLCSSPRVPKYIAVRIER